MEEFLNEVLSHIKFPFVKDDIRSELEGHILDRIKYYIDEGYSLKEAEVLAISHMGNPKEIGIGLNKQHNPILGWMIRLTNSFIISVLAVSLFFYTPVFIMTLFNRSKLSDIPKENIEYRINLDDQVRIDDRIIKFTNIIYERNGNMNIIYTYREKGILPGGWSFGTIGHVSDDLGNEYHSWTSSESGHFFTKGKTTIPYFPKDAEELIIDYDLYNRQYRLEIPLKVGEDHD